MTNFAAARIPTLAPHHRAAHFPWRPRVLLALMVASCVLAGPAAGQPPAEVRRPAAGWRLLDLGKVTDGPLAGDNCYGINAADLDLDGDVDLVVTFQRGGRRIPKSKERFGVIYWLENLSQRGASTPKFRARIVDDRQRSPKVARIGPPHDGRPSIVVPCYLAGETVLYRSTVEMEWTKTRLRSRHLKQPVRAVVADVNRDGRDDVVVTSIAQSGEHLAWFRAPLKPDGDWEGVVIAQNLPPLVGLDAGDVDADGDLDLVAASPESPSPWLLRNLDGRGARWGKQPLRGGAAEDPARRWVARFSKKPLSQTHVRLTDIDGDGDLDCVETSLENGYVAWRENNGSDPSKRWTFHSVAGNLPGAYCFDVGDLDGNRLPDLVVPADGAGGVILFRNRRKPGINRKRRDARPETDSPSVRDESADWKVALLDKRRAGLKWPNVIRLADIDQDGDLDILATDWGRRAVVWIRQAQPAP